MSAKKKLTCIACPRGCPLSVEVTKEEVLISGNFCPKGLEYGKQEAICPKRVLTTTLACAEGERLPVKTSAEIPLADMRLFMEEIRKLPPCAKYVCGEVVASGLCGTAVNLIVTG